MRSARLCGALAIIAATGCVAHKKYFVAKYEVSAQSLGTADARFPPAAALALLAKAKVVAFAPPDECADGSGGDVVGLRCGEVMSGLEEAAMEAGFEVVSWQALRGDQPALVYAQQNEVDVLFEVNRLGADPSTSDVSSRGSLQFLEVTADGVETALAIGPEIQQRCRDLLLEQVAAWAAHSSLLLDVKMVSVAKGRALWSYRRLFSPALFAEESSRFYFVSTGRGATMQSPKEVLCVRKAAVADPFAADASAPAGGSSSAVTFEATLAGNRDTDLLRRISRAAAGSFIELLVFIQEVAPTPRKTPLKRPARPKETATKKDANCEWLLSKKSEIKPARMDYFLEQYPECRER